MDCAWVSSGSLSMSQNCAPYSARHSGLPQTCSALDTPWNFRGASMVPLCSHTGLVGPIPEGRWRHSWTNCRYERNLGSLNEVKLKRQVNKWKHPGSPCTKKVPPTQCAMKVMFIVAYDMEYCTTLLHQGRRQMIPTIACSCSTTFVQSSGENDDT